MRKTKFVTGEYYHIYNRGTDKRDIFLCEDDIQRFFLGMSEFNSTELTGSIYERKLVKKKLGSLAPKGLPLVMFVAYCLNPNHYHFVIKQIAENGVSKFMHRLGSGYTNYFNEKYKRSGGLFQGTYKAIHISSNEYLLHLSVYVNLNFKVHGLGSLAPKLYRSSWGEYIGGGEEKEQFCMKEIILDQFSARQDYETYCKETLIDIVQRKENKKGLQELLLEA
ncbi:MAG: transposase [Candidatus Campbellbacteria bacterium]|nr:transposase [Candidatus Campbellbacteria bacterium]